MSLSADEKGAELAGSTAYVKKTDKSRKPVFSFVKRKHFL